MVAYKLKANFDCNFSEVIFWANMDKVFHKNPLFWEILKPDLGRRICPLPGPIPG